MNAGALLEETHRVWGDSPPLRQVAQPLSGDVVALGGMTRFDVEWAILGRDSRHPGQLLVVAADGQPLVGSTDIEIPASAPGGPLVLRCRFGGWVDAGLLAAATRTGTLAADDIERARDRLEESTAGAVVGSILTREVDDDLEYRALLRETLEPAWRTLAEEGLESIREEPEVRLLEAQHPPRRQSRPAFGIPRAFSSRTLALAATLLLAFGATFFWRQHQELRDQRDLAREQGREIENLLRQQEQLEDEDRRQRETASAERERFESDSRRQLDELSLRLVGALGQAAVENPVVIPLGPPRGKRGQGEPLRLPAEASHLILAVELDKSKPGRQRYRAELRGRAASRTLWTSGELRQQPRGLWIGLPAALLPPGEYLLRIHELGEGDPELVAEYPLRIRGD